MRRSPPRSSRRVRLRLEPLEERILPTAAGLTDSGSADSGFVEKDEDIESSTRPGGCTRALRRLLHAGQRQLLDHAVAQRDEVRKQLHLAQQDVADIEQRYQAARTGLDELREQLPPETRLRQRLEHRKNQIGERLDQTCSEVAQLEQQIIHLESTDAIQRWVHRYGEQSAQVQELRSSLRQQCSDLKSARARLRRLETERAELQRQAAALPRPPEALVTAVTLADADLLNLRCTTQQRQARVAECQDRLDRAEVRLHAASRLGRRQAQTNVSRICDDHRAHVETLHQAGAALVAMVDQNSHVRLSLGSFSGWRSSESERGLPPSDNPAIAQYRLAEQLLHSIDQYLVAELNELPRDSCDRFAADVHADLGVHFIVESANALLDARESFVSRHDQLRQALTLLRAAGLSN